MDFVHDQLATGSRPDIDSPGAKAALATVISVSLELIRRAEAWCDVDAAPNHLQRVRRAVEFPRRLNGMGLLRPSGGRAATAEYWLSIFRQTVGPHTGEFEGVGRVQADASVFLAASSGEASLTLDDGTVCQVRIHRLTPTTAQIRLVPPFYEDLRAEYDTFCREHEIDNYLRDRRNADD